MMRATAALWFGCAVVAASLGISVVRKAAETAELRERVRGFRLDAIELARLRAEHERLRRLPPPPAELEQLRADHAALPRLRAELEALKRSAGMVPAVTRRTKTSSQPSSSARGGER